MTTTSKPLIDLAREFAARAGAVDERVDSLVLRGTFASADEQAQWIACHEAIPAPFRSVQVYDPEIGGDIDASEAFDPARTVQLTIVKPAVDGAVAFLFSTAAAEYLQTQAAAGRVLSAEMESRAVFQTRGLDVAVWNLDTAITPPPQTLPISPRKLVKDYVPDREVVDDLSPWLITTRPAVDSPEFIAWRIQAARRLLGALVNSASAEQGVVWLQASGPPILRIRADDPALTDAWEQLTACAEWVFLTGLDIEVRHLILAVELARAYRPDLALPALSTQALEAARATYEAHVQSASRETLKALADLRKTVIDETQKVTQRAQDLTSGLWRDVAVSAAPFVIKVLGDASKTTKPEVAAGFYFAAAIFIAVSFGLQVRINKTFLDNQRNARAKWFQTLYGYISANERRDIAEEPIEKAVASYRETRVLVGLIYLTLIIVLVWFGVTTLRDRTASPPPPAGIPAKALPARTSPHQSPRIGGDNKSAAVKTNQSGTPATK